MQSLSENMTPVYLSHLNNTQCEQKYALHLAVLNSRPTSYGQRLTKIHRNRSQSGPSTYGRGRLMAEEDLWPRIYGSCTYKNTTFDVCINVTYSKDSLAYL